MKSKVIIALRMAGIAGQSKLAGIFRYLYERYGETAPWDVELVRTNFELTHDYVAAALARSPGGFIASIPGTEDALAPLAATSIPAVVADMGLGAFAHRAANLAVICNSAERIGRAAADYLRGQGVARGYAFLHAPGRPEWSGARFSAYRDALAEHGLWCHEIDAPEEAARLPRGTAIFAANDDTAFKLLAALKERRRKVPADFAVLGVDNDTLICENSRPRLSSIQPDFESEGFMAAQALDAMMRSPSPCEVQTLFADVKTIVRRESTADVSHAGRLVQKAVAFIEANATRGIGVADVVAHLGCSRRLADLRFRQLQGRSMLEAITERRLAAVRERLRSGSETLETVSETCGFGNSNYLKNLFKKRYSMTMSAFRKAARNPSGATILP